MKVQINKRSQHQPSLLHSVAAPALAIAGMLVISSLLLLALGYPVLPTLLAFFIAPMGSLYDFSEVVMKASVLIIIAWGLSLGFRANIWNIGAEGQFIMGAVCGGLVALYFHGQEGMHIIPLMMIAGVAGGVLWAWIPAWLKSHFSTNEILTSLMLVYIAQLFLGYLVHGPIRDRDGLNFPQSVYFSDAAIYPFLIEGTRLSITPLFVAILFPLFYLLAKRSYIGFQLRVSGQSGAAARYAGFNARMMVWVCFTISGALAGLAGISEVSANISQLIPVVSPGYGFTAIIVAFLGQLHPTGILFSGFLMALIYVGAESAQLLLGLPVSIGGIFQGLILFCLLASHFFLHHRLRVRWKQRS